MKQKTQPLATVTMARLAAAIAAAYAWQPIWAATTTIADAPLTIANSNLVKPNLLFVLDDSGSMNWDYMPDHVRSGFCRNTGAGLVAGANYNGTFNRACCESGDTSASCWEGAAPFVKRGHPPFLAAEFNNVAYNPAIRYRPGMNQDGAAERPSMTAAQTGNWTNVPNDGYDGVQNSGSINLATGYPDILWCPNSASPDSACIRNDNYVLPGKAKYLDPYTLVESIVNFSTYRASTSNGEGLVATGAPDAATTTTRKFGPHYYRIVASEYCKADDASLRDCQQGSSGIYTVPAPVRWCSSDTAARAQVPVAGSCQANRTTTYSHARYPTKYATPGVAGVAEVPAVAASTPSISITLSGCSSSPLRQVSLGPLMVNGVDLFSGATTGLTRNRDTLGGLIRTAINNASGTNGGYVATGSNNNFKIIAPVAAGNLTVTATINRAAGSSALCLVTFGQPMTFAGFTAAVPGIPAVPASFSGKFERVDIVPSIGSYAKSAARTDCAGASCSYAEEMTNFANWWAYYHTRMQMMKSSASLAFKPVSNTMRLGYMSLNNNTGSDFLGTGVFESTHRKAWFKKLLAAKPSSSTPLREALAKAGRYYGGRLTSINSVTATDPMEYSCQKNFTILSTDGFWNGNVPKQLDGSTDIGDQDGGLERPKKDGNLSANTLADVSAYYFKTDLRHLTYCTSGATGLDVCGTGNGPGGTDEVQNMVTMTLGLGASGFMQFQKDYATANSGDFFAVKQGSAANPVGGICAWQASGACNWPAPTADKPTAIDDLWHAAVNSDASYFSATDAATLYGGIASLIQSIESKVGTAAAATTSNPNITATDNTIYVSTFTSAQWTGELKSQSINVDTGAIATDGEGNPISNWSAATALDANASRTIHLFDSGAATGLRAFNWSNLSAAEKSFFSKSAISAGSNPLSQFCVFGASCLTDANQDAAAGEPLVRYLAGERINEGLPNQPEKYFRLRTHLLGDIVNSEAVYVGTPLNNYSDDGYATHATAVASRTGMVYVAANDGMLHAFNASTGAEAWAFVPTAVLPNMYRLADKLYANEHVYLLDSSPVVAEAKVGGQWRTLLVGGMGAGGRTYYALDVTDPASPKALWEFKHNDLGLTFGKAEIGKLADGTWVVLVPSGYNNVSPGDGKGHLFVLDAGTGSVLRQITTSQGGTGTPSGMAHITAWVDDWENSATIRRVYGGDNEGNIWRFDVNDNVGAAGYEAQRIGVMKSALGDIQPITSKPELGEIEGRPVVMVGTGRYLGLPDVSDVKKGSIYVIKDRMTNEDYGDVRLAANNFVKQTLTTVNSTTRAMSSVNPVNWAVDNGCYVDLPEAGERVTTDPALVLGTLVVNSNVVASGDVCKAGGSSWANYLDYRTCGPVGNVVSAKLGDAIATRPMIVKLPNNKVVNITRLSNDSTATQEVPVATKPGPTRRLSWRDLVKD